MVWRLCLSAVLTIVSSAVCAQPLPVGTPVLASDPGLAEFIDAQMETGMERHAIRGAAVSIVADGQLLFAKGYGYADASGTRPIDAERSVFRLASVSKLFIATAVMQLVEQGRLDLDSDVNAYLAGTNITIPEQFDQPVRLRHLLTHSAGFEESGQGYYLAKKNYKKTLAKHLHDFFPARVRPPDQIASYSNWPMSLAALIVENVSGIEYYDYLRQRIFDPLGMARTTHLEPLPDNLVNDVVNGVYLQDCNFADGFFESISDPSGALSSTATDMAKFMIMHLQHGVYNGVRLLSAETVSQMQQRLFSVHVNYPGIAHGFFEKEINGRRLFAHHGVTRWFRSLLSLQPGANAGVFFVSNGPRGLKLATEFKQALYDRYFPATLPQLESPADFNDRAQAYAGRYRDSRHNFSTLAKLSSLFSPELRVIVHNDSLLVRSTTGTRRYIELEPNLFRYDKAEDRIAFATDKTGKPTAIYRWRDSARPAYKVPFLQSNQVHTTVVLVGLILFIVVIGLGVFQFRRNKETSSAEKSAEVISLLLSLCFVLFVILCFFAMNFGEMTNEQVWPTSVYFALAFPIVAVLAVLPALYYQLQFWTQGIGTLAFRLKHLGVVIASLMFLLVLNYWNALGWFL